MAKDDVLKDRLIALQSHDAHAFWVSPKVLASMDIPDHVDGGAVVRYPDGKPTGVFMDNAQELIGIPSPSEETLVKRWSYTVRDCWSNGFTGVHDALLHDDTIEFFHRSVRLRFPHHGILEFDTDHRQAQKNVIGVRHVAISTYE